jgi:hypothetical protein
LVVNTDLQMTGDGFERGYRLKGAGDEAFDIDFENGHVT